MYIQVKVHAQSRKFGIVIQLMLLLVHYVEIPWDNAVSIARRHIMLYMYIGKLQ